MAKVEIVPFGKYKGQPIEAMAQDKEYCDWLSSQDWFRTRFTAIHTLIVNNFGTPDETPEHNALQAKFTDSDWTNRFLSQLNAFGEKTDPANYQNVYEYKALHSASSLSCDALVPLDLGARLSQLRDEEFFHSKAISVAFEVTGADVDMSYGRGAATLESMRVSHTFGEKDCPVPPTVTLWRQYQQRDHCRIECKPVVGDDYPGILRQMKASKCDVLLIGDGGYTGTGATFEQVTAIFKSSRIKIILLSDIELL